MKKAKVLLTSLAILTVVGGALAFKANRINHVVWCAKNGSAHCDQVSSTSSSITNDPFAPVQNVRCTTPAGKDATCNLTSVTNVVDL